MKDLEEEALTAAQRKERETHLFDAFAMANAARTLARYKCYPETVDKETSCDQTPCQVAQPMRANEGM